MLGGLAPPAEQCLCRPPAHRLFSGAGPAPEPLAQHHSGRARGGCPLFWSMHALLHAVPPILQQATTDPCFHQGLLNTHRQVWINLFLGHCSFLLGPGEHKAVFVRSKNLFPSPV